MLPLDKVQGLISKHSKLEKDLSSGEIDKNTFAIKSKEYSDLNEIIREAKEYNQFEKNKSELENIINDNSSDKEMKDLAEIELSELKHKFDLNEKKSKFFCYLRTRLMPKMP